MTAAPRIRHVVVAAALVGISIVAGPVLDAPSRVDAAPMEINITQPGPLGPITVLGDSVMLGSGLFEPTLAVRLAERGWGPVRFRAGEGYRTGATTTRTDFDVSRWITQWRAAGWNPRDVVVNLGANDSGFCLTDLACARRSIVYLVDHIGPNHRIWWPMITQFPFNQGLQDTWNTALQQVAAERQNVFTWDWPSVMAAGGFASSDRIHLTPDGYRRRSVLMADAITADLATARRTGTDAALAVALSGPTEFVPLAPTRVLDTRRQGGRVAAGRVVTVDVVGSVPAGTTAVAVNLTAVEPDGNGYLTAYPCDRSRREVSSVNHRGGATRAALAVIPLSADGAMCVYAHQGSHVVVDLQGAFVPADTSNVPTSRLEPLATPRRLLDTRETGRAQVLRVPAPVGATAVAVTLTTVGAARNGFLSAYPCGGNAPEVSNVNVRPGETIAGAAFVPVGDGGEICVFTSVPVDVVVDLTGAFRTDRGLRFVPVEPTRMLDTRSGTGGWTPIHGRGQQVDVRVVPASARAVTGTLTHVGVTGRGFLTAHGCGTRPPTSSVNGAPGGAAANSVTTGVSSTGRLCVFASTISHSVFDTTGWWVEPGAAADAASRDHLESIPPPDRRVYMVADSVGLGARTAMPTTFGAGWQVTLDGTPALFVEQMEQRHVRPRMAGSPWVFGDHAVVAGGYNYPYWDPARFDRSIDSIVAALREAGVRHIHWVTLRDVDPQYISAAAWRQIQPYYWYFPTVNRHLEQALSRHRDLSLVDWAAIANRTGLTYDAIHLNTTGAAVYSALVRDRVNAAATRVRPGSTTRIRIPDAAGVAAVSVNLTATSPRHRGFLTAHPCSADVPVVSNANYLRDQTVATAAIVPVSADGHICVTSHDATNVVVDLTGRFPSDGGLVPVQPRRLVDTRRTAPGRPHPAQAPLTVQVAGVHGVAADASAVALSVTAVDAARSGFVEVRSCDRPSAGTSNVNFAPGRATPNLVIVEPSADGRVCLVANADTELIVDLFAWFEPSADLRLGRATRVLDSRASGRPVERRSVLTVDLAAHGVPRGASGVVVNLTATGTESAGFLTAFPCGTTRPEASNLNAVPGRTVANLALVRPDTDGRICVYVHEPTHVVVDLLGSFGPSFAGTLPQRMLDTRR